ncbi:energy-coupling factor transporter ATPase [candidate division KSB1 bacterium]|nr:energy-coupling factor transporter ATPase [candidate division KSB1 bacterium]
MAVKLELHNIRFRYSGIGASDQWVLQDVSLSFRRTECTAIVGPSGSGKTTLIQHFTGLLKPSGGRILVDGMDIWDKSYDQNRLRRRIGLVFQFPEAQLFEETVFRDVAYGPSNFGLPEEEIKSVVEEAMSDVGLTPDLFASRSPFHLSEGEKRRVAIAGVLAMKPDMVVFDEPTAGLDASGIREMERIIDQLIAGGTSVVVVTHHMDFVNNIAHRALVMRRGKIIFDGPPDRLFAGQQLLRQAGLTMPQFLREKALHQQNWPASWRKANSLRTLLKLIKASRPESLNIDQ